MEVLTRIYDAILSDGTARFFCSVIAIWWILAIFVVLIRPLAKRITGAKFITMTPSSLATLGVLGTFTGILIGLLDFDVSRVDDSVPELLVGLKIAFTTSIVGIAAAITFRVVRTFAPIGAASGGVTPEDIHAVLIDMRDDGRLATIQSAEQLTELRKAISSEGDSSLLTQMQKLRTSMQDGQTELIREFRQFSEHMVENNQKAIIEALEQVIREFNQKLTEQFGDNFKQLNEAVFALVAWQNNYREHIETLEKRFDVSANSIEASQKALESVRIHSERIPEAIQPLEGVLKGINAQTELMDVHLETLAALRDKAVDAFPVIESNLEKLTTQFAGGIEDVVNDSRQALAEGKEVHDELRKGYTAFLSDAEQSREQFSTELDNTLQQMSKHSSQEFARHGELIEAAAKEAQTAINGSWTQSVEKMNDQFTAFDTQMQQELTRSLELLGRNLASVSEKFVSDYTPLTQKLQELVKISRGLN